MKSSILVVLSTSGTIGVLWTALWILKTGWESFELVMSTHWPLWTLCPGAFGGRLGLHSSASLRKGAHLPPHPFFLNWKPYLEIWSPSGVNRMTWVGEACSIYRPVCCLIWCHSGTQVPWSPSQGSSSSPVHLGSDTKGSFAVCIHSCVQFPQGISSTKGRRGLGSRTEHMLFDHGLLRSASPLRIPLDSSRFFGNKISFASEVDILT